MSQHNLISAWNHAEDMAPVIPLTTNVSETHHETSAVSTTYSI